MVNVSTNVFAHKSIKNIVQYGFNLGTHTVHHRNLGLLTSNEIKDEVMGVERTLETFMSPSPRLSLFRAPHGTPYILGNQSQMDRVSSVAATAGYFHVGWQIDPTDYNCENNITCVTEPIFRAVDAGRWGMVLLHFIFRNTANALPSLIAGLKERKCEFFTVEQFVRAKYGKSSAEVMNDFNGLSKNVASTKSTTYITIIIFIFCMFIKESAVSQ